MQTAKPAMIIDPNAASAGTPDNGKLQMTKKTFGRVGAISSLGGDRIWDISTDNGGYAAGVGVRFRLSRQFALEYSTDYAVNNEGDGLLYSYLGQRL